MPTSANHSRRLTLAEYIRREWYVVSVLLLLATALLVIYRPHFLSSRFDNNAYDLNLKLSPFKATDTHIALILIDNQSIAELGYWPWRRKTHARLLQQLQQSKAVAFDVLFQEPNPAYPLDDDFFAAAIKAHGKVVLPTVIDVFQQQPIFPLPNLTHAAKQTGFINIFPSSDGVVRNFLLRYPLTTGAEAHHLLPALLAAGGDEQRSAALLASHNKAHFIPFTSSSKPYTAYSYSDVLQGRYNPNEFADKYVLIGAWSSGLGDVFPTPISTPDRSLMPGVEILAYGLHSALHDNWIFPAPLYVNLLFNLLPVLLLCIALATLQPRYALLATFGMIVLIFIANWLCLHFLSYKISISSAVLFSLLTYPLWHWRSQETTLRYVNKELAVLSEQDPTLRLALLNQEGTRTLPDRLSFLQHGIGLIREAQQRRAQTLHFISHDMRSPQNAILALISLQKEAAQPLQKAELLDKISSYANSTLGLVDDFMDLAKAEAMELVFQHSNVSDLLAEVCDDAWPKIQQKSIKLYFNEPETPIFAAIVPSIFKRALSNLLDNAIQYSDPHTQIRLELKQDNAYITIQISDQGWGIPESALDSIFQPFARAHQQQDNAPKGTGLGLAFVETVILRHHGSIDIDSSVGTGTTFTLHIPNSLAVPPAPF